MLKFNFIIETTTISCYTSWSFGLNNEIGGRSIRRAASEEEVHTTAFRIRVGAGPSWSDVLIGGVSADGEGDVIKREWQDGEQHPQDAKAEQPGSEGVGRRRFGEARDQAMAESARLGDGHAHDEVDGHGEGRDRVEAGPGEEDDKVGVVALADAGAEDAAVVVEALDAGVADRAMVGARRSPVRARRAVLEGDGGGAHGQGDLLVLRLCPGCEVGGVFDHEVLGGPIALSGARNDAGVCIPGQIKVHEHLGQGVGEQHGERPVDLDDVKGQHQDNEDQAAENDANLEHLVARGLVLGAGHAKTPAPDPGADVVLGRREQDRLFEAHFLLIVGGAGGVHGGWRRGGGGGSGITPGLILVEILIFRPPPFYIGDIWGRMNNPGIRSSCQMRGWPTHFLEQVKTPKTNQTCLLSPSIF